MTHSTPNPKTNYHHGDLCQSLIEAASVMIQEHGIAALSMRKLADVVGVSRTAPYHHFKDKHALLCAIAEEGFRQQGVLISNMCDAKSAHDNREPLEQFVERYIRFAIQYPAHYELMYGGTIWKHQHISDSLKEAAHNSFKRWLQQIEHLQAQGVLTQEESSLRIAQVTWATLHGLCRLANDGVYIDQENILDMGRSAVRLFLV